MRLPHSGATQKTSSWEISMRITSLEHQVSQVRQDMAVLSDRMDRIEMHLARIERRLELVDSE
jgi:predicted  nucleic acid-binding Zn-ribbon protein